MKKILLFVMPIIFVLFLGCFLTDVSAIPNPWVECGDDISCASKKAGFNFPLLVKNYKVRAMEDMIEFEFNLNKNKTVKVRKSQSYHAGEDDKGVIDLSGVYENYPVNKAITLNNGVVFNVRGNKKKFYVANFSAETGYYSIYSNKGLNLNDLKYMYKLLKEAEAPRYNEDEINNTIEQLRENRRNDGIVEPVYTQDCFPRTLQKSGVTKDCFERANMGQDIFCSASQIKMIKEYYKKGYKKDPLNNGDCQFCAE